MPNWPEWWEWDLELSPHLHKRMSDRGFDEIDLRIMLERAGGLRPSEEEGRWVVTVRHQGRAWEVVVEPMEEDRVLMVITAYAVS